MKQMSKKKVIAISLSVVLVAAGIIGVTLAMLKAKADPVTNDFAGAAVNIGVLENGNVIETGGDNTYDKVVKDTPVAKEVQIKNIHSEKYPTTDTYVRVRLVPIFRNDKGQTVAADMSKVEYTYGNSDGLWKKQTVKGETYYYYTKALAPNEASSMLITAVTYTGEVPEGAEFELQVLTEGVAAKQSGSLSAWGLDDFDTLSNL